MKNSVDKSAPPLIRQVNNGNWLPQQEAEALRDGSEFVMTRERKTGLINVTMFALRGALTRSRIVLLLAACGALAAGDGSHADDVFGDRPEESVSFRAGDDKTLIADDWAKYTISFGVDGRVRARIDCVMTTWKSPGSNQLHMGPPWLTRALCTPGSVRNLVFLALIAAAGADDFAAIGGAQATGGQVSGRDQGPVQVRVQAGGRES